MTTMNPDVRDAIQQARTSQSHKAFFSAFDSFGTGLAEAVIGILGQDLDDRLGSLAEPYRNEQSQASGRGVAQADEDTGPEKPKSYMRPNGDLYFPRSWGTTLTDVEVLVKAREAMQFPLLYGPPGTGKTALAEAAFGEDLITMIGTGDTQVSDLVGGYVQTADGGFLWVDGPLVVAAREGRPFLIDEIGLIDTKELAVVYGAMDGRREVFVSANPEIGVVKAQPGFYVIAATNPNAPGVRLSEALLSRFSIHVEVTTDWDLAGTLSVPKEIVTIAQNLNKNMEEGLLSWAPQFRELLAFRDLNKVFGREFAIRNLIATAPESDRAHVATTVEKVYGKNYLPARI